MMTAFKCVSGMCEPTFLPTGTLIWEKAVAAMLINA